MKLVFVIGIIFYASIGIRGEKEQCGAFMNRELKGTPKDTLKTSIAAIHFIINIAIRKNERNTDLQKSNKLNTLSLSELRTTAEYSLYTMMALCKDSSFDCKICDIFFIATETAMGDSKCYFQCSYDKSVANANNLPTDDTFATYINIGLEIERKANTDSKKEALIRKGMEMAGKVDTKAKRILPLFPVALMAMKAILTIGSLAAVGWASRRAERNGHVMGTATKIASPLLKVAQAGGGCFMATSHVNVQLPNMNIVAKRLSNVNVGDMVESLDPYTGKIIFTPIYYIAHSNAKVVAALLSVFYLDEMNGTSSMSLSGRHLVYATKSNMAINTIPLIDPLQAKDLSIGDYVWVMNKDNQLKPQQIIDILPFLSEVRHPLTENHHIIVDGVHASVHVLNEALYRAMTSPLRALYSINPEWNKSTFVERMVQFVESVKEPIFNEGLIRSVIGLSMVETVTM